MSPLVCCIAISVHGWKRNANKKEKKKALWYRRVLFYFFSCLELYTARRIVLYIHRKADGIPDVLDDIWLLRHVVYEFPTPFLFLFFRFAYFVVLLLHSMKFDSLWREILYKSREASC